MWETGKELSEKEKSQTVQLPKIARHQEKSGGNRTKKATECAANRKRKRE